MTELETLHSRIFSSDDKVRGAVTADDIRRYLALQQQQKQREEEREQILAAAREAREREERENLRGLDRIKLGLRSA
jgi:hypothetical protein